MKIHVDHIALIQCPHLGADKIVEADESATVTDILNAIGIAQEHQRAVVPFINQQRAKRNHPLHDGDDLFLSLAVGGG